MRTFTLGAVIAALLLVAGPAAASSWTQSGGSPGNPGFQPVDPGGAPFSSAYWSNSASDEWVMNGPVVTPGHPTAQRIAYGTADGSVHIRDLLTGGSVGASSGVNVDDAPIDDADGFGDATGPGYVSFVVLEHLGGTRILVLHNDENQNGGVGDIALAQFNAATGALISDQPVFGSDGYAVSSSPVLSDPDAGGHRYLLFTATNSSGEWLGKVQIANATGSNPTLGTSDGIQVNNANIYASPAVVYLNNSIGTPTEYVTVSFNASSTQTVRTYRVSDLAPGPVTGDLNAKAGTPSVPLSSTGLNPGSPGSGAATTPALYATIDTGASTTRAYRLTQTGNSQTLTAAASATLTGSPSQGMSVTQTVSAGGTLSAGKLVVSTHQNLYVLNATTMGTDATHSPTNLSAGTTGFSKTAPAVAGNNIYISRDNGHALVLALSDAQALGPAGFSEQAGNSAAVAAHGRPAVSRWFALFASDRGLFAYETDDTVSPTASLTAPANLSTLIGSAGSAPPPPTHGGSRPLSSALADRRSRP